MGKIVVLVCGRSGSGKSSLAKAIVAGVGGAENRGRSVCINQDDYFARPFLEYSKRADDSFEGPDCVDWDGIVAAVANAAGTSALSPSAPFVVVVEGHLVAGCSRLVDVADACVVLSASAKICSERRLGRRPRTEEETAELSKYIADVVNPSFVKYGAPALASMKQHFCSTSTSTSRSKSVATTTTRPLIEVDSTDAGTYLPQVSRMRCRFLKRIAMSLKLECTSAMYTQRYSHVHIDTCTDRDTDTDTDHNIPHTHVCMLQYIHTIHILLYNKPPLPPYPHTRIYYDIWVGVHHHSIKGLPHLCPAAEGVVSTPAIQTDSFPVL